MMNCQIPLIAAPMFLVSTVELVIAASEAGAIGTFPALNFRPLEEYGKALKAVRSKTKKPFGVNIIVNKSNTRQQDDLRMALDAGANMFITSLGSPKDVIKDAHQNGAKVFCDVTNLEHALKVQDLGADGVIAVGAGAGGHAGPISLMVLVPWLKTKLNIPVIAAGGIARGEQLAASLALGASGVSVGTRFIASTESPVDQTYKDAVLKSTPEDIVMTSRISGTPAAVIRTPYIEKMGTELPWWVRLLKENPQSKKYIVPLIHQMGSNLLEKAGRGGTWKTAWSAGQSVGLVDEILPVKEIIEHFVLEYEAAKKRMS